MNRNESVSHSVVYDSGGEGPLALPWREASQTVNCGLIAQQLHVNGALATLACPKHRGRLVIDGPSVCCSGGGKRLLLKTEDLLGAKVKGEGVCDGKQQTSVVLCYQATSTPRDDNDIEVTMTSTPRDDKEAEALLSASYGELVLYELPRKPSYTLSWPLAFQELVVHQINSHIESIRGAGGLFNTVSVENDTHLDDTGFSSLVSRAVDDQDADEGQEQDTSISRADTTALQLEGSDTQLHNALVVSRPWQRTPVLPLATSRLSFQTQGDELVVTCRPSRTPRWWITYWIAWIAIFIWPSIQSTIMLLGREDASQHHWNCDDWSLATFKLFIVVVFLCWATRQFVDRVYKKPTLRVSPDGWSLKLWPDQVTESFILKRFLSVTEKEISSATAVHGAKVLVDSYTHRNLWGRSSLSAVLHTAAGAFPLNVLLGTIVCMPDASFKQQDYETLVGTINRHLSAVRKTPVTIQNEVHPSVFTQLRAVGVKCPITVREHDGLLTQQRDAVRAVNFNRGGRWVSTDSLDASTARSTIATVSHMHANLVSSSHTGATSRIQFICDLPGYMVLLELFPFPLMLVFLAVSAGGLLLLGVLGASISCIYSVMSNCFLFACYYIDAFIPHLRRVVTIEVSPSRRRWKVQMTLGRPPFSMSRWYGSFVPLKHYVLRLTSMVAEGSTDDLQGCEVRFKQVKNCCAKGVTQTASLFLHHHRNGAGKPKELPLDGGAAFELTNISEKLIIAQAINSALATVDRGFDMAENC